MDFYRSNESMSAAEKQELLPFAFSLSARHALLRFSVSAAASFAFVSILVRKRNGKKQA